MAQTRDEERLANAPIGPLMLKLAVPAVAAQVINMLYNICLLYTSDAADE